MKLYPVGWFNAPSRSFQLFSGKSKHDEYQQERTNPPDFDEMVHVDGKQVVWSAGNGGAQRIFKSYRQVLTAKQALLCSFVGVGNSVENRSLGVTGDSQVGDHQPNGPSSGSTGHFSENDVEAKTQDDDSQPNSGASPVHDDRCLCVLQGLECVKIYAPDGAEFEVALPCKAARMWALPRGILIERAVAPPSISGDSNENEMMTDLERESPKKYNQNRRSSGEGTPTQQDAPTPMFFSLLHPLEELKPVSYTIAKAETDKSYAIDEIGAPNVVKFQLNESLVDDDIDADMDSAGEEEEEGVIGEFMCDPKEHILFVDNVLCLVVTYHEDECTHSIWSLLPATAVNAITSASRASRQRQQGADQEDSSSPSSSVDGVHSGEGEDDDDVIESEVFMQRVWTSNSKDQCADTVFVSHDVEGVPLVCIMQYSNHTLQALSVRAESRGSGSNFSSPMMPGSAMGSPNRSFLATPLPSLVRAVPKVRINVEKAFEMKIRSAQPIIGSASGTTYDMIVLTLDNQLQLFRGNVKLCQLDVPLEKVPPIPPMPQKGARKRSQASRPPINANMSINPSDVMKEVVRVEHAVSNRVNVVYSSGLSLRVCTGMGIKSRLLRPCMEGIDCALPADIALSIRMDVAYWSDLISHNPNKDESIDLVAMLLVGEKGLAKAGTSVDIEWAAFIIVLAQLIQKVNGSNENKRTPPKQEVSDNWYERMMNSDFHKEYEQRHFSTVASFEKDEDVKVETNDNEDATWYLNLPDNISITSNAEKVSKHMGVLILCLHLVYEECKLSTLTWPLIRPLAGVLSGLVEATLEPQYASHYLDHYARDRGLVEQIPLPKLKKPLKIHTQAPPDIFDWLMKRMKRASSRYRSKEFSRDSTATSNVLDQVMLGSNLSSSSATMRPFPELESCFRTQQLCCFLELLSGGTGDEATVPPLEFRLNKENKDKNRAASKSPVVSAIVSMGSSFSHWMDVHGYLAGNAAERTVLGMVWFGFTMQDLETLTFGLSIPLREALHYCRSNPSSRWPADAYVLVGREDMAALALAPAPPTCTFYQDDDTGLEGDHVEGPILGDEMFKTPIRLRSVAETPGAASVPTKRSVRSPKRRASETSVGSVVTTAVTPVWRRLPSGQGVATQVADDILWGGEAANSATFGGKNTFLRQHQQRGVHDGSTSKLYSIADFARLSASASAEVGGLQTGQDMFSEEGQSEMGKSVSDGGRGGAPQSQTEKIVSDPSGFVLLQRMTTLRFGSDRRVLEVCRLLRSSSPVRLVVERGPETSDHELVATQQAKLLLISRRTMALQVGRGMITLGTVRPLLTDTVDIPPISLSGKIPPNNAIVKLDLSSVPNGDELLSWPRFHNGAAAGLRLAAGRQVTPLTRTWIAYNRPETPNHTHAGFLLALGLHGHLGALTMADIYEYLAQGHDATTVAIMLGLSASKRATMAPTVSKMLCLHIPSLLPAAFSDMEVPSVVQTGALMGVGLLYEGTAHRLMTEFLLAEIGRRPTSDRCIDRESYSLAAGLSLGLVTLGFGARPGGLSGLADLRLEDRLHRYMVGGLDPDASNGGTSFSAADPTKCSRVREGPYVNVNVTSPGATLALAFIFMKSGNESVATRLAIPDTHFLLDYVRPDLLMLRVIARNLVLWDTVEPTEVWLLSQIPPAIRFSFERLAGGGTTAAAVAAANVVKARHAKAVDEDEVLDEDDVYQEIASDSDDDQDNASLNDDNEDEARLPSPPRAVRPVRRQRSMSHDAAQPQDRPSQRIARLKKRGNSMASMVSRVTSVGEDSDGKPRRNTGVPVDEQGVRQAHANIIAGACFSIGLRFVGTASVAAQRVLVKYLRHFLVLRNCEKDSMHMSQRPDKSTLEMCLGATALALAMVMVGTGDLATLRLLRSLRFKTEESVSYGNHMAIGSAIGMLFLGGGRSAFSNDNSAIAALVCAFYPRFPLHTSDNQYHLQALRHLYVLAAEQRCIEAYDIDNRSPCYLPMEITIRPNAMRYYSDRPQHGRTQRAKLTSALEKFQPELEHERTQATVIKMVAPCLLPPLEWISSIRVASARYWPIDITLDGEQNIAQKMALWAYRVLCVKRKVGHLSYMEDPQGVSSLLARPRLKLMQKKNLFGKAGGAVSASSDIMRAFTADPHVLAFAKHFCAQGQNQRTEDQEFVEFCTATLYDCLTHEKPEMLNAMINLFQSARVFKETRHSFHVRNLLLLNAFYDFKNLHEDLEEDAEEPLVGMEFLLSLNSAFQREIDLLVASPVLLKYYLENKQFPSLEMLETACEGKSSAADLRTLFASYLHYYSIPDTHTLSNFHLDNLNVKTLPKFALQHKNIDPSTLLRMARAV
eukprot:CAMPEP_0203751382 /NCGR_PEP_ID=MMETSP0098-20131031/5463_1 /ASSEMBLY_ACC=CAM_ASM_000208 /TAXON_ID=96639 /ORGANISM=" , Strain NY0313808BC1" /LENGTH=2329 /DNA_ID=CAMNT_0050641079 /DNA_START=277 /DNA_END=7263 /DNA_ORIENTATION=+